MGFTGGRVGIPRVGLVVVRTALRYCDRVRCKHPRMPMREIDLETWPRRHHFAWFDGFADPRFHLGARVRLGPLRAACRRDGRPVALTLVWLATAAANSVPELRQRVRGGRIVEHDIVHPSFTVMGPDELFTGCLVHFDPDLERFVAAATPAVREASTRGGLTMTPDADDARLFITSLPWVEMNSMVHPRRGDDSDAVPTIGWGRLETVDGEDVTNIVVTAHHGLADGLHVSRFVQAFEAGARGLAESLA